MVDLTLAVPRLSGAQRTECGPESRDPTDVDQVTVDQSTSRPVDRYPESVLALELDALNDAPLSVLYGWHAVRVKESPPASFVSACSCHSGLVVLLLLLFPF